MILNNRLRFAAALAFWLLQLMPAPAQAPIHLSAPWAAGLSTAVYNARTDARLPQHPTGDGTADDLPALQADINTIRSAGGGILYLPAGTYRLDNGAGGGLTLSAGVILEGDGMGRTVIQYGEGGNPNSWGLRFDRCEGGGVADLSLVNACPPEPAPYTHPVHNAFTFWHGASSRLFLSRVAWDLGYGDRLQLTDVNHLEISDCEIEAGKVNHGVLWLDRFQDLLFDGNKVHYHVGRILMREGDGGLVRGNAFTRDGGIPNPRLCESGGVEASFSDHLVVEGNTITVQGRPDTLHNDGEAILTQTALAKDFRDVGRLTGAQGRTLTDTAKDWSSPNTMTFVPRSVVCLTSGLGLGQWRTITGHTANALTLTSPFDPAPAPGDQYGITSWSALNLTLSHNTLINNVKGIEIYEGGWNVRVVGNTMIDSDGIRIRGVDRSYRGDAHVPDQVRHDLAWECVVDGNVLSNPHGERLSHVTIEAAQIGPGHGNTCWNNTVTGNVLVPHEPVAGVTARSQAWGVKNDGVGTLVDGPAGTAWDPMAVVSTRIGPGQVRASRPR